MEISRSKLDETTCIVQRVKNENLEVVKEITSTTGELFISDTETKETITITRILGEKIQF